MGSNTSAHDKALVADRLLDGHILFFKEKEDGYSGLLKDGRMIYNTAEHKDDVNSNGEYEVTIYWIWPEYYEQLTSVNSENAVVTKSADSEEIQKYISD